LNENPVVTFHPEGVAGLTRNGWQLSPEYAMHQVDKKNNYINMFLDT